MLCFRRGPWPTSASRLQAAGLGRQSCGRGISSGAKIEYLEVQSDWDPKRQIHGENYWVGKFRLLLDERGVKEGTICRNLDTFTKKAGKELGTSFS